RHTRIRAACYESHSKTLGAPGLPQAAARAYLRARGRPTQFLATLRLVGAAECLSALHAAGMRDVRALDGDGDRRVGGPLWPLIRLYYRLCRVRPYGELVAARSQAARS